MSDEPTEDTAAVPQGRTEYTEVPDPSAEPEDRPCAHHAALREAERMRRADEYYHGSAAEHWRFDYCPACWSEYLAHLTPERWAQLHAMAAQQCRPGHYRPSLPLLRPHRPPGQTHARIEKPAQAVQRLQAAITLNPAEYPAAVPYLGKTVEPGWYLATTDGHRALLVPGMGELSVPGGVFDRDGRLSFLRVTPVTTFTVGQAFHLALKQLAPLANERSHAIRLTWHSRTEVLVLSTRGMEASGQVEIEAPGTGPDVLGVFNGEYLQDLCGVWPLVLKFPARPGGLGLDKPIEIAPAFPCFRCVVMPMRD